MAKVRELLLDDNLTDEQAKEAKSLFGSDPAKLSKDDLLVLAEYVNVIEGKLAPEKLAKAIGLIRATPVPVTSTPSTMTASWIGTKAGEVREDNSLKMKLIWCPPGKFTMGSPKSELDRGDDEDQVSVTLTQGFWLGRTEVTQKEWQAVMETKPWTGKEYVKDGDDYPATYVSWDDATEFCRKLTERERNANRLPAGWEYTLPT